MSDTLLVHAKNLHCAQDGQTAANIIRNIQAIDLFAQGLPNETKDKNNPLLRATTLDSVLSSLYSSSRKYPENKKLIEKTVTHWNYCGVVDRKKLFDHAVDQDITIRSLSGNSNTNWAGFKSFGIIASDVPVERFDFTTPYIPSVIRPLADRKLLKTYIERCLPHPDDEHLYRSFGTNFISRLIPTVEQSTRRSTSESWPFECFTPKLVESKKPAKPVLEVSKELISENIKPVQNIANTEVQQKTDPTEATLSEATEASNIPTMAAAKNAIESAEQSAPSDTSPPVTIALADVTPTVKPIQKTPTKLAVNTSYALPVKDSSSRTIRPTVALMTGTSGTTVNTNSKTSKGFSGSISLDNKSFTTKNTSLNFAFAYKPFNDSYWFARSAFNVSDTSNPVTYSWGIGYDDWHAGTWAIQLNHWGPISSSQGLDIKNAVAELSYKLKSDWLTNNILASTVGFSKPVSGKSSLSWGWSWNPYSNWFIRSTLVRPTDTGEVNWSYGFGYTQYTKSSFSLEYNNWGVNKFPKTNFKDNGQVSLIYRWAY